MKRNDMFYEPQDPSVSAPNNQQPEYSVEELLQPGESILWQGKPDRRCYSWKNTMPLLPIAVIWLFIDLGFIIGITSVRAFGGKFAWFLIPFFLLHLMPVWLFLGKFAKAKLEWKNVVYAVTNRRVIMRGGVIGIDFKSINHTAIEDVSVNVGIIENWRQKGSIIIKSEGQSFVLVSVDAPYEVFRLLQKTAFDVKADVQYPNAMRPQGNPGYNTQYPYNDSNNDSTVEK